MEMFPVLKTQFQNDWTLSEKGSVQDINWEHFNSLIGPIGKFIQNCLFKWNWSENTLSPRKPQYQKYWNGFKIVSNYIYNNVM